MDAAVCAVCQGHAVYTCPGCGARTCSVACVRAHKVRNGSVACTGRPRAAPTSVVHRSRLTPEVLAADALLLAGADAELGRGHAREGSRPQVSRLRHAAAGAGIVLEAMPAGMARARRNASAVRQGGLIEWTVELVNRRTGERAYVQAGGDAPVRTIVPAGARDMCVLPRGVSTAAVPACDLEATLASLLCGHTVLEFPTLSFDL